MEKIKHIYIDDENIEIAYNNLRKNPQCFLHCNGNFETKYYCQVLAGKAYQPWNLQKVNSQIPPDASKIKKYSNGEKIKNDDFFSFNPNNTSV